MERFLLKLLERFLLWFLGFLQELLQCSRSSFIDSFRKFFMDFSRNSGIFFPGISCQKSSRVPLENLSGVSLEVHSWIPLDVFSGISLWMPSEFTRESLRNFFRNHSKYFPGTPPRAYSIFVCRMVIYREASSPLQWITEMQTLSQLRRRASLEESIFYYQDILFYRKR